jgi:hypothetical protein
VQAVGWLVAALVIERLAVRGIYALPLATATVSVVALLSATARHLGRRQW